ncbi:MAG TPA: FtsQ-type POTRA domain-containing protein [Candidatus Limnocylindrales bacterium]|nr:FtsQ-type POTRA domain-containing protein [Candidatus Limnocylindrales bacterium]
MRLVNRWRVLGVLLAAASAIGFGWLVTSHGFDLDQGAVELRGLEYTTPAAVRMAIGLPEDSTPNVFRISTTTMERALNQLPAVDHAEVRAVMPDRLVVALTEHRPIFIVRAAAGGFVIGDSGVVLQSLASNDATTFGLPILDDERVQFAPPLTVGGHLDDVTLGAVVRLAALTPEAIDSEADRLELTVDDTDGYVLTAQPTGWRAVFGHYTPTLRPVDLIDRQVQCLRTRLAAGEADVVVIYLAPLDDACGTYLPRTTRAPLRT